MKMKRLISLLLMVAVLCSLTTVFAEPEEPKFPITDEKITLSVLTGMDARVENYETNATTKWLEEKTNIHLDWEVVGDIVQSKAVILASGDYPDILLSSFITQQEIIKYGVQQGVFLPLNDLIEKYGYNTKRVFEQSPYAYTDAVAPDGNIYALSQVNEAYHMTLRNKMWINTQWLDNLGLEMPTTTDELLEVLIAFRDKDPNGNGKKDEIPLTGIGTYSNIGSSSARSYYSPLAYLISAFITFDTQNGWIQPFEGKVDVSFNKEAFREGLRFVRKLYEEGLIDPEFATQDATTLRAKIAYEDGNLIGMFASHSPSAFCDLNAEPHKAYMPLMPVEGPGGLKSTANYPYTLDDSSGFANAFIITTSCEHPEIAFKLADFLYSDEFVYRAYFGEAGKEYRVCEPGEIAIDGGQALYEPLITFTDIQNVNWNQKGNLNRSSAWRLGQLAEQDIMKPTGLETRLYQATVAYSEFATPDEQVLPPTLFIPEEENAEYAQIKLTVDGYVAESLNNFVTGKMSIDTDWDQYVKTLEDMGLPRYLEILQSAYDASIYAK